MFKFKTLLPSIATGFQYTIDQIIATGKLVRLPEIVRENHGTDRCSGQSEEVQASYYYHCCTSMLEPKVCGPLNLLVYFSGYCGAIILV